MKICFIPIDNRPVCYNLVKEICAIDEEIELFMPPREYLGSLTKYADIDGIYHWFTALLQPLNHSTVQLDTIILSLDTIAYGGLIPSRRSDDAKDVVLDRVKKFHDIWTKSGAKVYALSSIMRISNNNYNEEEKEYWKDYGEKIFRWSYEWDKTKIQPQTHIPHSILEDYLSTRSRNFEINKTFLEWQKQGYFDELIFTKDDCAEYGLNIKESRQLQELGGKVITGADEVPLSLLSKSVKTKLSVKPIFTEPDWKHLKSNYEDVSIEDSVINQLRLAEIDIVDEDPDITLIVNNFREHQGEIVMGVDTEQFSGTIKLPETPYMIADVRNANGADNNFMECILPQIELEKFYGYSGWNTSANTIGTLLCAAKIKYQSRRYNEKAFKNVEMVRLLDDWAYQANVRQELKLQPINTSNIQRYMQPYEDRIKEVLKLDKIKNTYSYPWDRFFEIEVKNELS